MHFRTIFIFSVLFIFISLQAQARFNSWKCVGLTVSEYFIPGTGYLFSGQFDKMAIFGGMRWYHTLEARKLNQEHVQSDPKQIFQTVKKSEASSGQQELHVFMNKETWKKSYHGTSNFNLANFSSWDLYEHNCESNTKAYTQFLAPLNFSHFYKKWEFWLPTLYVLYVGNNQTQGVNKIILGRGLTKSDYLNDTLFMHYQVGIGEEAMFRGILQNSLYYSFQSYGIIKTTSRYLALASASAIFGVAHNGVGTSASPLQAFVFGLYLGMVYQPEPDKFDLTTSMAIHSWWNAIGSYYFITKSKILKSNGSVSNLRVPLMNIHFQF